jgi:hypothetical protein
MHYVLLETSYHQPHSTTQQKLTPTSTSSSTSTTAAAAATTNRIYSRNSLFQSSLLQIINV